MKNIALCFYGLSRANIYCWKTIQDKLIDSPLNRTIKFSIFIHTWQEPVGASSAQVKESSTSEVVLKFLAFQFSQNCSKIQSIQIDNQVQHKPEIVEASWGAVNRSNAINAHLSIGSVLDQANRAPIKFDGYLCIRTDAFLMNDLDVSQCSQNFMHSGRVINDTVEVEDLFFYVPSNAIKPFLRMRYDTQDVNFWSRNIYNFLLYTANFANLKVHRFNVTYSDGATIWRPGLRWKLSLLKVMFVKHIKSMWKKQKASH
jgi:hypothetical protein